MFNEITLTQGYAYSGAEPFNDGKRPLYWTNGESEAVIGRTAFQVYYSDGTGGCTYSLRLADTTTRLGAGAMAAAWQVILAAVDGNVCRACEEMGFELI